MNASNPFIEDCLNETTQEISQDELAKKQFDSLNLIEPTSGPSSNISNENYIIKVVPTEFDLSVDSVFQSKSDILDVIVPDEIEEKRVPQGVFISSKPALIAVQIASHEASTNQDPMDDSRKNEQISSIPTLIISNICSDTPPPIVASGDNVSLKPKKVLKAQDSLEIPKDDRDKFEPTKRVDSFDSEDAVNSVAEYVKARADETSNVRGDSENDFEDDFIIITEDEVNALKVEEQESLIRSDVQTALYDSLNDSLTNTKSENSCEIETKISSSKNDPTHDIQMTTSVLRVKRLSSSHSFEIDDISDTKNSQNITSVIELTTQPESNKSTLINARNDRESLPAIQESTTLDTVAKASTIYNTSNLFTSNQAIILEPDTNLMQLNEHGPLKGAYSHRVLYPNLITKLFSLNLLGSIAEREHLKWINAEDIPNNPYSKEALQRRLSQTKGSTKVIDINLALASKSIDDLSAQPEVENGKPLQIVLGAGEPDQLRFVFCNFLVTVPFH